jgi:hypothetical protein
VVLCVPARTVDRHVGRPRLDFEAPHMRR